MEILIQHTNITIKGNVDTVSDGVKIRDKIEEIYNINPNQPISLLFSDTSILPSSLIGTIMMLIHEKKYPIKLLIKQQNLYALLERLNLITLCNVEKV